jgi:hypothetical protein
VQNKNHFRLEVAWVVHYKDAFKKVQPRFLVLFWASFLENLEHILGVFFLRVVEQELQAVAEHRGSHFEVVLVLLKHKVAVLLQEEMHGF